MRNTQKPKPFFTASLLHMQRLSLVFRTQLDYTHHAPDLPPEKPLRVCTNSRGQKYLCVTNSDIYQTAAMVVKKPNGCLFDERIRHNIKRTDMKIFTLYWTLSLDKKLRLQIFFKEISIPTRNTHVCIIGQVRIRTMVGYFRYCGIHSNFYLFTPGNNVHISIHFLYSLLYHISAHFTLIDSAKIVNIPVQAFPGLRSQIAVIVKQNYSNHFYHIFENKDKKIVVTAADEEGCVLDVFDGPDFLSPKIPERNKTHQSTTFQCVLSLHAAPLAKLGAVTFESKEIEAQTVKVSNTSFQFSLNFPRPSCDLNICALSLENGQNLSINATLIKMKFDGNKTFLCVHGGLAFYDYQHEPKELTVFCEKS